MASATSETPSSSTPNWDVFLSFCGRDTRYNFTSHLYSALDRQGVLAFMDDPELRSGEVISEALIQAIRESKIYIVVLSENYASSRWCLDELEEILKCYKTMQRLVMPVFYNISPIVVRQQRGSFAEAFKKHEIRFGSEKINAWRVTLMQVTLFSGYSVQEDRPQIDIMNKVVDRVLHVKNAPTLDVAKYSVGLDSRVEDITELLSRDVDLMPSSSYNQTSLSSASSSPYTRWDIYLSFRAIDTRYKFVDFLFDALNRTGIRTFMDEMMPTGTVISESLVQAIHESETYIVVLSENYASSTWCLSELVEILNCHQTMKRLVIPVFYNIDPSVVRYQIGSFKQAFRQHKIRLKGEMDRVNQWDHALREVADFSGCHMSGNLCYSAKSVQYGYMSKFWVSQYFRKFPCFRPKMSDKASDRAAAYSAENRSEASTVDELVDRILIHINSKTLDVTKYPVGLESRVKGVTTLYRIGTRGVIKFGIYGMVGVGKTTLAKVLFNQLLLRGSFRDSSFLANVRETSGTFKGLESLQQKLINDVVRSKKKFEVDNVEEGTKHIRERICSAKILVLIDDINDLKQYESLVGPFASGSVVIVTTRDEEILDKIEVEPRYRYKVNELDNDDSLVLFTKHAFGNAEPDNTLMALSEDILRLASGLPLALEVFGSYLYKQTALGWKYYIEKLQRVPNSSIQQKLIISLDALESDDSQLKEIFLDIACFFIGRKKEEVLKILETQYSYADYNIDILKKRCLLTINNRDVLEMHDLLIDTGREIARNRSPIDPGKNSRLWELKDITDVLKMYKHKETEATEVIIPSNFYYPNSLKGISFDVKAFKRMSRLRFLYLKYVTLTGNFELKFGNLRWLCWECCPLKCLPPDFYPQKLVILELPHSEMRAVWEPNMVPRVFEKLKTLNMKCSLHLTTTPDFINLPFLETLNLEYCESLEEVHVSLGSLVWLISLNFHGCINLRSLPDSICNLRSVKNLNIGGCSSLEALPIELGNIESIMELSVEGLTVSELPESVGRLSKLVELKLSYNKNLKTLPELPPTLKWIRADGCTSMEKLPNLSNLKQAEILVLTDCHGLTEFQGLTELSSLRELHFGGCNSSVLAYIFTERFFQILSEFWHQINFYIGSEDFPDWISQSRNVRGPTMSLDLLPNVSHNLLGMILCFKHLEDFDQIEYSVENSTSGFILQGLLDNYNHDSLMVIVPTSIFPITEGDTRIKLRTTNAEIVGIHLLFKHEIQQATTLMFKKKKAILPNGQNISKVTTELEKWMN